MNYKIVKPIYYILAIIGFIMMAMGCTGTERVWLYAGIVLMVLCTLINLKWYRCPHCGAYLGSMRSKSNICPSCGEALDKKGETADEKEN